MNILFCYRNWLNPNKGGVQRVNDILAIYFIEQGHHVFYLTLEQNEKDDYVFPAKIFHLPDTNFFSVINYDFYHQLLNQLSIDVIVNHDSTNERSKLFLNTGMHTAQKISLYHQNPLQGLNRIDEPSGRLQKILMKTLPHAIILLKMLKRRSEINYLIKNSDKLIVLSEEYKKGINKLLRIKSAKIEAIHNPCKSCLIKDINDKKKHILFVSRLEIQQKRPDKMLQIWSNLYDRFPDWQLIFLGDGSDRDKIEEMVRSLKIKNVRFEGFVAPEPYYQDASIICMTSDYEGFGLVLVEAMQYGVVPIAFNNWGSLKDIITDQETGILVSTNDISTYVARLDQLMSDDVMRKRIYVNATKHVKNFQIESIGPKWDRILEDLIKS